MNAASTQQGPDVVATKLSEGVVQSGTLRTGSGLIGLGCAGLFILWALQIWESTNRNFIGDKVFVATLGNTALVMGSAFVILPFVTAFAIGIHGALLPRAHRGSRVTGLVSFVLAFVALVLAMWAGSTDHNVALVVSIFVAFGLLIVGTVLLIQNGRRMRSFAQECLTHVGCRKVYAKKGLRAFVFVMALLWVGGLIWYVVELTRIEPGYTTQPGGYVAAGLLALGLVGGIVIQLGTRGQAVWVTREGQLVQSSTQEGSPTSTIVEAHGEQQGRLATSPTAEQASSSSQPTAADKTAPRDDTAERLRQLQSLKDSGLLTDEEYEAKRKAIVDSL